MADQEITQGTIVRLKSGGPNMTVTKLVARNQAVEHERADVAWFDDKGNPQSMRFPVAVLDIVGTDSDSSPDSAESRA